jgi:hypothetical protein
MRATSAKRATEKALETIAESGTKSAPA